MIELSEKIAEYIKKFFGENYLKNYRDFFYSTPNYYIRLFNSNEKKNEIIEQLNNYGIQLLPVNNIANAYQIIKGNEIIGKTFHFILGKYYIQSLSSMIPPLVLNPSKNDIVLDLCAAPGSKTTQLAEIMHNEGTLIANEISIDRIKSLVFNIEKLNLLNVGVINEKGEALSKIFDNYFDKILVDAPCSALGILQKKGEVNNWWNENKIPQFSNLQYRLLLSAAKMCKVGGEIVYSTCTLSLEENELVVNKLINNYPLEVEEINLPLPSHQAFTIYGNEKLNPSLANARRILPWEVNSEGFFIAKLRKIGEIYSEVNDNLVLNKLSLRNLNDPSVKNYLNNVKSSFCIDDTVFENYNYLLKRNEIFFVNKDWHTKYHIDFVRIGARLGLIDKDNKLQLYSLAAQVLGKHIKKNIVKLESLEDLKIYLKGGLIKKSFSELGQKLVMYNDEIIGTAVATKEGLKSQFPRNFRTQEIVFPGS
ncbi:NOL1/NOP2/sun family putative RNA methylase [Melioribacteraceae bacterium 4301-Me]|uniref:NOL1/NOP2/sun family putative RNA methylase n=1 Tax=Pyranulibacter aquaticus TaxID=3163344 RepID=UPI00359B3925